MVETAPEGVEPPSAVFEVLLFFVFLSEVEYGSDRSNHGQTGDGEGEGMRGTSGG